VPQDAVARMMSNGRYPRYSLLCKACSMQMLSHTTLGSHVTANSSHLSLRLVALLRCRQCSNESLDVAPEVQVVRGRGMLAVVLHQRLEGRLAARKQLLRGTQLCLHLLQTQNAML